MLFLLLLSMMMMMMATMVRLRGGYDVALLLPPRFRHSPRSARLEITADDPHTDAESGNKRAGNSRVVAELVSRRRGREIIRAVERSTAFKVD